MNYILEFKKKDFDLSDDIVSEGKCKILKRRDPERKYSGKTVSPSKKKCGLSQNQFYRDNNLNANTFTS